MKKIKFSHRYDKLPPSVRYHKEGKALLLQALKIHYNDLSERMIGYDTSYFDIEPEYKIGHYPLPKTELILLIFRICVCKVPDIFTTIRRYTPRKWEYYKNAEGEIFEVVMQYETTS